MLPHNITDAEMKGLFSKKYSEERKIIDKIVSVKTSPEESSQLFETIKTQIENNRALYFYYTGMQALTNYGKNRATEFFSGLIDAFLKNKTIGPIFLDLFYKKIKGKNQIDTDFKNLLREKLTQLKDDKEIDQKRFQEAKKLLEIQEGLS